nr:hypothetical protein CTI12_AA182560 [Tanacetum cinerariifolium]
MKVKESLNVTFDESPPPTKLSPLVDDDVGKEEAIMKNIKIVNTNNEDCDNRDLIMCMISLEVFDHLILSAFMFSDEYSICLRIVIIERNDVVHAMLLQ